MSKSDPNEGLAADAVLATDLGDEKERTAAQLEYFGGDVDDIDNEDFSTADDGSSFDPANPAPAPIAAKDEEEEEDEESDDDEPAAEDEKEEDEESDDEESDDDAAAAKEDLAEKSTKGIPKHRFDEVNQRRKAAEAELAVYKAKETATQEGAVEQFDFRANEKAYMELMLDGDVDGALAKREEIDAARESKWKSEATTTTKADLSQAAAHDELLSLSREAEKMFDVFSPDSENYNQAMLDKVMIFMRGYESSDMSRSDAFVAGLADVIELYGLEVPGVEVPKKGKTTTPTGKRREGGKKKEEARENAHQPVGSQGKSSAALGAAVADINNMSDEEIEALPEKTLARMRGDFL